MRGPCWRSVASLTPVQVDVGRGVPVARLAPVRAWQDERRIALGQRMDPVRNPYSPGAGAPPPALVGRDAELATCSVAIQRFGLGKPERSVLLTGLRGVGKTVLLREFGRLAEGHRWVHHAVEITEELKFVDEMSALVHGALRALSPGKIVVDRARRALGVLKSFQLEWKLPGEGDVVIGLDPVSGPADSARRNRSTGTAPGWGRGRRRVGRGPRMLADAAILVDEDGCVAGGEALRRATNDLELTGVVQSVDGPGSAERGFGLADGLRAFQRHRGQPLEERIELGIHQPRSVLHAINDTRWTVFTLPIGRRLRSRLDGVYAPDWTVLRADSTGRDRRIASLQVGGSQPDGVRSAGVPGAPGQPAPPSSGSGPVAWPSDSTGIPRRSSSVRCRLARGVSAG